MSFRRILKIVGKDFAVGPRKSFFIWALVMPFALTLLFQVAFGSLFEPKPRLGLVDLGRSELTEQLQDLEGFEVTVVDNVAELLKDVEEHNFDAGIVLSADFDEAVQAGQRPLLPFYLSGESLASNRIIISVTALELVRELEDKEPPVMLETVYFGEPGLPVSTRLVPVIVFYALAMAGMWVPSSSIVEEKEKGTLTAILVTSVRVNELLTAKWLLGFIFAIVMANLTLILNSAFGPKPLEVLVVVIVAAALTTTIGLLIGIYSKTATMLFTLIKSLGIFLFVPVIFYLFPDWPQWIARLFPLYWVIEPIWVVSVMGGLLKDVLFELGVAMVITLALGAIAFAFRNRVLA